MSLRRTGRLAPQEARRSSAPRVARALRRTGGWAKGVEQEQRSLLSAASAQTRLPLGEGTWLQQRRRRCAFLDGFSLHADTWVHSNDVQSLERLARYGARGPVTLERLSRREDGKLEYRLKKPSPGGATVLVLTAVQLLKRLCALVVKPRVHLTRFFGVFAPKRRSCSDRA